MLIDLMIYRANLAQTHKLELPQPQICEGKTNPGEPISAIKNSRSEGEPTHVLQWGTRLR